MKAKELLKDGETAIVIFTDELNLMLNENGTSASGVWRIRKNLAVDKVIVYRRNKARNVNEIFIGDFAALAPSQEKDYPNRFVVEFNDAEFAGETAENWNGFTDAERGAALPIRYVKR